VAAMKREHGSRLMGWKGRISKAARLLEVDHHGSSDSL
jgi:hypothetical protein